MRPPPPTASSEYSGMPALRTATVSRQGQRFPAHAVLRETLRHVLVGEDSQRDHHEARLLPAGLVAVLAELSRLVLPTYTPDE